MPNYAVSWKTTAIGTHAEVEAELEGIIESLMTGTSLHLVGISELSRDRDRCIGYLLCDEVLWVDSAYHLHTADSFDLVQV